MAAQVQEPLFKAVVEMAYFDNGCPAWASAEDASMSAEVSSTIAEGILQAAVRLFARKGYEATSTREIVEAAGVTKPMIYYYFKNKEGLYEAVLTRFLSQFSARLRAVVDEQREPRDYLVEVVWAHLDYFREHRDFAKFFYAVFFGPDESAVAVSLMSRPARCRTCSSRPVKKPSPPASSNRNGSKPSSPRSTA